MIAVGDVNGDGRADVVSANSTFNNAAVLFGDGAGGLDSAAVYATGGFPLAIDLGDIDGDGDLDMVTSNFSGVSWTVLENDGQGRFVNPRTMRAAGAGSCATLYDPDGDGDMDMTGIDEIDDLIFLFRNGPASAAGEEPALPADDALGQNFPNPFNPSTVIPFTLRTEKRVRLAVVDPLGREVAVLVDRVMQAGSHTVDFGGRDGGGRPLASGVYFCRMTASAPGNVAAPVFTASRKLVLLR